MRIIPRLSVVSSRFPAASFVLQDRPDRDVEIVFASDPRLFYRGGAAHRTAQSFYTSREEGLLRLPSGESTYFLPEHALRRLGGSTRIHYVMASYGARGDALLSVPPGSLHEAPWIALAPDRTTARPRFGGMSALAAQGARLAWGGDGLALGRAAPLPHGLDEDATDSTPAQPAGIDVSDAQGTIDWERVAGTGIAFAYIKATEAAGNAGGGNFASHWADAQANGIFRGAYHFFRPKVTARAQAEAFINKVGSLESGDMPPVLDVEREGDDGTVAVSDLLDRVEEWLTRVEGALKLRPMIYTGPDYWSTRLGNSSRFTSYPLWISDYNHGSTPPSTAAPDVPGSWPTWNLWQFNQRGRIAGITGDVDLDRMNNLAMVRQMS